MNAVMGVTYGLIAQGARGNKAAWDSIQSFMAPRRETFAERLAKAMEEHLPELGESAREMILAEKPSNTELQALARVTNGFFRTQINWDNWPGGEPKSESSPKKVIQRIPMAGRTDFVSAMHHMFVFEANGGRLYLQVGIDYTWEAEDEISDMEMFALTFWPTVPLPDTDNTLVPWTSGYRKIGGMIMLGNSPATKETCVALTEGPATEGTLEWVLNAVEHSTLVAWPYPGEHILPAEPLFHEHTSARWIGIL